MNLRASHKVRVRVAVVSAVLALSGLTACSSSSEANAPAPTATASETPTQAVSKAPKAEATTSPTPEDENTAEIEFAPLYNWNMTEEDVRTWVTDFEKLKKSNPEALIAARHDWISRQVQANPELGVYNPDLFGKGHVYYEDAERIGETVSTALNTMVAFMGDYGNKQQMTDLNLSEGIEFDSTGDEELDKEVSFYLGKRRVVQNMLDSWVNIYAVDRQEIVDKLELSVANRFSMADEMAKEGTLSKDCMTDHYTLIDPQISEAYVVTTTNGAETVYDLGGDLVGNQKMIESKNMPITHNQQKNMKVTLNLGGTILGFEGAGADPWQP